MAESEGVNHKLTNFIKHSLSIRVCIAHCFPYQDPRPRARKKRPQWQKAKVKVKAVVDRNDSDDSDSSDEEDKPYTGFYLQSIRLRKITVRLAAND
jgi:hypothetical protein